MAFFALHQNHSWLPLLVLPSPTEESTKGDPEQSGHGAVENEIHCTVDQGEQVEDLAHWSIDVLVESVPDDGAQEGQDAGRKFGAQEEEQDGQEHLRGPIAWHIGPVAA